DLFSLGCILYEMSTGQRPFSGSDTMAILSSLALDTPEEPLALNPEMPPGLSQIIMRLLEKQPANRPGSAREVADMLKKQLPDNTVVVVAQPQPIVEVDNPFADLDASLTEPPPSSDSVQIGKSDVFKVETGKSSSRKIINPGM